MGDQHQAVFLLLVSFNKVQLTCMTSTFKFKLLWLIVGKTNPLEAPEVATSQLLLVLLVMLNLCFYVYYLL